MSFIWCDLETTGLDPQREEILSVGLLITDDNMREVARFERDVHVPLGYLAMREMSDYVREMHTKSGLLQRCEASTQHLGDVEREARAFLTQHLGEPAEKITERPPMAGNSVNFDRGFLTHHCPGLIKHFNYRLLDVSTLKVLALATVPGARAWNDSRPDAAHTPLADIEGSLLELAHWRAVLASVETAALEERVGVLSAGVRDLEQANSNCQQRIVDTERAHDDVAIRCEEQRDRADAAVAALAVLREALHNEWYAVQCSRGDGSFVCDEEGRARFNVVRHRAPPFNHHGTGYFTRDEAAEHVRRLNGDQIAKLLAEARQ